MWRHGDIGAGRRIAARYCSPRHRLRAAAQCPGGGSAGSAAARRGYAASGRNTFCCTYPTRRSRRRSCRRPTLYPRPRFGYVTGHVWLVVALSTLTVCNACVWIGFRRRCLSRCPAAAGGWILFGGHAERLHAPVQCIEQNAVEPNDHSGNPKAPIL
eukprot:gene13011-biopygen4547